MNTNRQWLPAKRPNGLVTREKTLITRKIRYPSPAKAKCLFATCSSPLTPPNEAGWKIVPATCLLLVLANPCALAPLVK